jgi:uncharacterized glyoxalase superfamily protein PhnB
MWPCKDPEIPKATGCYINVTEVNKLFAEFKAQGVIHPNGELQDMPWKMRQFSILDNDGNIIHFGEDICLINKQLIPPAVYVNDLNRWIIP